MKKAMSGAIIILVLGLIVLMVFLVFPKMANKAYESIMGKVPKQEQDQSAYAESYSGQMIIRDTISGTKEEIKNRIINELYMCNNQMRRVSQQNTDQADNFRCTILTIQTNEMITRTEIISGLEKLDVDAAKKLKSGWKADNTVPSGSYLICADYDWPDPNDLYFSKDTTFDCE